MRNPIYKVAVNYNRMLKKAQTYPDGPDNPTSEANKIYSTTLVGKLRPQIQKLIFDSVEAARKNGQEFPASYNISYQYMTPIGADGYPIIEKSTIGKIYVSGPGNAETFIKNILETNKTNISKSIVGLIKPKEQALKNAPKSGWEGRAQVQEPAYISHIEKWETTFNI